MAAKKPCAYPACGALVESGYCERHAHLRRQGDRRRASAAARLYGRRWRRESKAYLAAHPFCEPCAANGERHLADLVDHRVPHRGDERRFWDQANWQAMAKTCHDRKTAREDGGFGRAPDGAGRGGVSK